VRSLLAFPDSASASKIFKDAEVISFGAPYGVFSVARWLDPELDPF
jgi:hypothetical protein